MSQHQRQSPRLGEILTRLGMLDEDSLVGLLELRQKQNTRLGELALKQGLITESQLVEALSKQLDTPIYTDSVNDLLDDEVLEGLQVSYLRENSILPFKDDNGELSVVTTDPLNSDPISKLQAFFGSSLNIYLITKSDLETAFNLLAMRGDTSNDGYLAEFDEDELEVRALAEDDNILDSPTDAPMIRLVNNIFTKALNERASDIHFEPYERNLAVRYRIDGVLYDKMNLPANVHPALVSRLKVMSGLDIAEKRLPQDGRIKVNLGNRAIDVRISSIPTAHGERVVLRLLDQSNVHLSLDDIGLPTAYCAKIRELLKQTSGVILVTGPTGSGKTTTLYAMLKEIDLKERNVITIEDPVEYRFQGIGQLQVNPKIDLTFAKGLRSILRQDPDVIMVGEIRDNETAQIAIQASLTGHLVMATLHTNDAPTAVARLIDMKVEPFLIASSLKAVIAQRLVRKLCTKCRMVSRDEILHERIFELLGRDEVSEDYKFYESSSCDTCAQTGYIGRTGVFEILEVTDEVRQQILNKASAQEIRSAALKSNKYLSMKQAGFEKMVEGVTSPLELMNRIQE